MRRRLLLVAMGLMLFMSGCGKEEETITNEVVDSLVSSDALADEGFADEDITADETKDDETTENTDEETKEPDMSDRQYVSLGDVGFYIPSEDMIENNVAYDEEGNEYLFGVVYTFITTPDGKEYYVDSDGKLGEGMPCYVSEEEYDEDYFEEGDAGLYDIVPLPKGAYDDLTWYTPDINDWHEEKNAYLEEEMKDAVVVLYYTNKDADLRRMLCFIPTDDPTLQRAVPIIEKNSVYGAIMFDIGNAPVGVYTFDMATAGPEGLEYVSASFFEKDEYEEQTGVKIHEWTDRAE